MTTVKAFYDKSAAVKVAWDNLIATSDAAYKAMDTQLIAQAALEKAWLQAYYLQQYWAQLKKYLTPTQAGSAAITWRGRKTALDNASTADATSTAGAAAAENTATTNLTNGRTALATLQAATAAAEIDHLACDIDRVPHTAVANLSQTSVRAAPASATTTATVVRIAPAETPSVTVSVHPARRA